MKHYQYLKRILGPEDPEIATSINNLAMLIESQGKYEEAKQLFNESLAIRKGVLGPEHPDLANSYNNMAGLLESQGKYQEAKLFYNKALVIRKKTLGIDHCDTATIYNNLATMLVKEESEYQSAELYYIKEHYLYTKKY